MSENQPTYFDKLMARLKNNPAIARILIVCIALAGVAATIEAAQRILAAVLPHESAEEGLRQRADPSPQTSTPKSSEVLVLADGLTDGPFSPVTFEEYVHNAMTYSRADRTDLQRRAYIDSLNGKRVIWRGPVSSVWQDTPSGATVSLAHDGRYAWFKFGAAAVPQLLTLKSGDIVQLTAKIDFWDVEYVQLTNSQLLRVEGNVQNQADEKRAAQD